MILKFPTSSKPGRRSVYDVQDPSVIASVYGDVDAVRVVTSGNVVGQEQGSIPSVVELSGSKVLLSLPNLDEDSTNMMMNGTFVESKSFGEESNHQNNPIDEAQYVTGLYKTLGSHDEIDIDTCLLHFGGAHDDIYDDLDYEVDKQARLKYFFRFRRKHIDAAVAACAKVPTGVSTRTDLRSATKFHSGRGEVKRMLRFIANSAGVPGPPLLPALVYPRVTPDADGTGDCISASSSGTDPSHQQNFQVFSDLHRVSPGSSSHTSEALPDGFV